MSMTTIASSGSRAGGPLVMNARPHASHIARTQREREAPSRDQASTKASIAAVSKNISSASVETTLAPLIGPKLSAQTSAGSHGFAGIRRRPRPKTSRPVPTNASAPGNRAAHSLMPNSPKLLATAQ